MNLFLDKWIIYKINNMNIFNVHTFILNLVPNILKMTFLDNFDNIEKLFNISIVTVVKYDT